MIKKWSLILFIHLILVGNLFASDLINYYKKGAIKLETDPGFGKGIDWENLFFDSSKDIAIAPNKTIFVSNGKQHNISMFTNNGAPVSKFGRKGEGPGDLYHPGYMTILDEKYLLVREYASKRRISIFDLSGKFVRLVKTRHSPFNPIALKNNKIAYLNYKYDRNNGVPKKRTTRVIIKDIPSEKENTVASIELDEKSMIKLSGRGVIRLANYNGDVFILKTKRGNLLVGASNQPLLKIYSLDGKLIRTLSLKIPPRRVTADYIAAYKNRKVKNLRAQNKRVSRTMAKKLAAVDFKDLFGEHFPFYRNLLIDSEGNILVFKWLNCVKDCSPVFQVYSPEGAFICETEIDTGNFEFSPNRRSKNICFTHFGIFGVLQLANTDDTSLQLIKVNIK